MDTEIMKAAEFAGERARSAQAEIIPDLLDRLWRAIREALTQQHEKLTYVGDDPNEHGAFSLANAAIDNIALDVLDIFRVAKGHAPLELPDGQVVTWQQAVGVDEAVAE